MFYYMYGFSVLCVIYQFMLFFIGILESLENDDSRCEVDSFWLILCAYEIKDFEDVNRILIALLIEGDQGLVVSLIIIGFGSH